MKQDYKKVIEKSKHVIKIIINRGYDAYFTGETVRNILLSRNIDTVEISTNAPIEYLEQTFSDFETARVNESILALHFEEIVFLMKPFQAEYRRNNKEKAVLRESDDILSDVKTRVFTIDALAMSFDGKITDIFDGYRDVNRKKIKFTNSPKLRLLDNPLNSLKAIKLVSELGFNIDYKTFKAIKKSKALKNLSLEEMLPTINQILEGEYLKNALFYLVNTKLYKDIPLFGEEFYALSKKFQKIDKDMIIAKCFVRKGEIDNDVLELCDNPVKIKKAVEFALVSQKGQYKTIDLYNYGLECALLSNQINSLLGRSNKRNSKLEKEYKALSIKKLSDLKLKNEDVFKILPQASLSLLNEILEDLKNKVLNGELDNDFDDLKAYVKEEYGTTDDSKVEKAVTLDEYLKKEPNKEEYHSEKFASIEKRMAEYEKILYEKEVKIKELEYNNLKNELNNDIDTLMQKYYEAMSKMNIYGSQKEKISREVKRAFKDILVENLEKYEKLRENDDE